MSDHPTGARGCSHVKDDETLCDAPATERGDHPDLCWFHDPSLAEDRAKSQNRGGRSRALSQREKQLEAMAALDLPTDPPSTLEEAQDYLRRALPLVAQGLLPRDVGDTLTRMVREFRRARKDVRDEAELEQTLKDLKQRLDQQRDLRGELERLREHGLPAD